MTLADLHLLFAAYWGDWLRDTLLLYPTRCPRNNMPMPLCVTSIWASVMRGINLKRAGSVLVALRDVLT